MIQTISIIGGDLRIVKLIEMLSNDGYEIWTYALEKAENLDKLPNVHKCKTIEQVTEKSDIIIGSIPLSSNNTDVNTPFSDEKLTIEKLTMNIIGKTFIAGSIKQEFYKFLEGKKIKIIDLLNREELTVLNTISTAEGAIQIAMEETTRTIHDSNIMVMGYGRVGKILANMLKGIGANVYCEARKNVDLAWIKAYGYTPVHLNEIEKVLGKMDIIINTIPHVILDEQN